MTMRVFWCAVRGAPGGPRLWSATIHDRSTELATAQAERRARAQGMQDPLDVFVDDIGAADDVDLDREINPHHYEDT